MRKVIKIILIITVVYFTLYFTLNNRFGSMCLYKWEVVKILDGRSTDGGVTVYDLSIKKYIGSLGDGKGKLSKYPGDINRNDLYCFGKSY